MAVGKFILKKNAKGEFQFNLLAANSQIIAVSESYKSKDACKNGIDSVRQNCSAHVEDQTVKDFKTLTNPKFELYQDKRGEFRFRLKASNGQIICTGEGYKAKAGCVNGIESIGKNAPEAPVVEED